MSSWKIDLLASAPPEDPSSGLSRVVWDLSGELVRRGHRVRVLYPSRPFLPAPPYLGVERVPVPVLGLRREPYALERAVGRAASSLLDPTADLWIANDEKGGVIELPRGGRAPPVFGMFAHDIQQHHLLTMRSAPGRQVGLRGRLGDWLDRRTIRGLEGRAFARARAIVVASEANRELLRRYYPAAAGKVHLVPLAVPRLAEVGDRAACRAALKLPLDIPVVAFIGQSAERQGLPLAVEAFRRVRVFFPGARLLVVGSTGASEPGVLYLGTVDDTVKSRVLNAADLFVSPARYQGFGLAPREAMRAGVATIVSRQVPLDGARIGREVRVVPEDDAGAYASEMAELLADPALRRSIGEAGRIYAERFSPERMAERFEDVFRPFLPA